MNAGLKSQSAAAVDGEKPAYLTGDRDTLYLKFSRSQV